VPVSRRSDTALLPRPVLSPALGRDRGRVGARCWTAAGRGSVLDRDLGGLPGSLANTHQRGRRFCCVSWAAAAAAAGGLTWAASAPASARAALLKLLSLPT